MIELARKLPLGLSAVTAPERSCEVFVDVWADEVRRLVPSVRKLREQYERDRRAADYGEDWSPTQLDLYERFRRLWAAQHHLVWAAHQLERWVTRLARERDEVARAPDPVLADLRNALEHLDEAVLDEDTAAAGNDSRMNRSLRRLPGARLTIDTTGTPLLFELIDPADIERRALSILTTTDALIQEAEDYVTEYGWPDAADE